MKGMCLFFLFVVAIACSEIKNEDSNDVPMLSEKIKAFINAKNCFGETREILAVNLDVQKDTLYLDIANTYPNIKGMKFAYDTTMYGVRTLFLGKKIKGFYKNSANKNFPPDIVEINKNQKCLLEREFTNWHFVYYKGALIRKSLGCDADTLAKYGKNTETGASFEAASAVANPGQPLVVNYSVGKSYSSNDVNQGNANASIPGFVALAHEFGHVQDYLTNGRTNFLGNNGWYTSAIDGRVVARSEMFATDVENRLRASLGLTLREFFSAERSKGITEGRILLPGTRTNANIINGGVDAAGNLIPITY